MPNALIRDPTTQLPADFSAGFLAPPEYIDDLELQYANTVGLNVMPGSCYIPSLGYAVNNPSTISLSSMTVTGGTWYHVYAYMSGSTFSAEYNTTAPVAYSGSQGYTKTGDNSRRYLGSFYALSSINIAKFLQTGNTVQWLATVTLLSAGTNSTAYTSGSLNVVTAGAAPVTGRSLSLRLVNQATVGSVGLSNADAALTIPSALVVMMPSTSGYAPMPISQGTSPGTIQYCYTATPTGASVTIAVIGYTFNR